MPLVGSASAGGWNSGFSINRPSATEDGDRMILLVTSNEVVSTTPPAGWEPVVEEVHDGANVGNWIYQREADSEPASYDVEFGGEHWHFGAILVFRGHGAVTAAEHVFQTNTATIDLPTVQAEQGDVLIAFGFHWGQTSKSWSPVGLSTIVDLPQSILASYEVTDAGVTESYALVTSAEGVMGAAALLLPALPEPDEVEADPLAVEVGFGAPSVSTEASAGAGPLAAVVGFGAPAVAMSYAAAAAPFGVQVAMGASTWSPEPPPAREWEQLPERQPLPPRPLWRYYAFRALSREWVHRELPLRGVSIEDVLSGPGGLTASIEPTYADLVAEDGRLVLREWDTVIIAEAAGQLRGGGILTSMEIVGDQLSLDCVGYSGYAAGMPLEDTLRWGGPENGTSGNGVNPGTVIWWLWDHLQTQPDGDLGVTLTSLSTPYRLGAWHNARKLATEDDDSPDPAEVEEPPIPIDRVWTGEDRKPAAATGKTVYWEYRLDWHEDVEVGAKIDELCQQAGIDYRETWAWADSSREGVRLHLELGYPRLGRRASNLRFVEGENISEVVTLQRSGDDFANVVVGYGAGEGSKQKRQNASARDGRLRRVAILDAEDVDNDAALRQLATGELGRTRQVTDITGFTAREHPNAELGSFAPGDDVLVETVVGWQPTRMWVRVLSYSYSPDGDTVDITCARSDSFDYTRR